MAFKSDRVACPSFSWECPVHAIQFVAAMSMR